MNIPDEIRRDITNSGMLHWESPYAAKTLRALFTCIENEHYLKYAVASRVLNVDYVHEITMNLNMRDNPKVLAALFKSNIQQVYACIDVFEYKLPYTEDLSSTNKVEQLHYVNSNFINSMSRTIIGAPDMIDGTYYDYDQDTCMTKSTHTQEMGPRVFTSGIYQPERFFTDTPHNRNNPYWEPLEVTFDPNSYSKMPGHRYASSVYSNNLGENRQTRKFPLGRHFKKNHDRSDFGFREGGQGDRRVQGNRGYNMSALRSMPSYRNY